MRSYFAILTVRFKTMLQYRAAAFAGFVCQLFWGFLMVMAFEAFFNSSDQSQPMSFGQTVSYIWLGQAFLGLLPWTMDREMMAMVQTGAVAFEMLRPLNLHSFWFVRAMAHRLASTLLRALPMFLFTILILPYVGPSSWGLNVPQDPLQMTVFVFSMTGVIFLSASISTMANITLIWTLSGKGVSMILPPIVTLFSGMIIPLPFFPKALQPLLEILPFRGLCDGPYRIFTGNLPASGWIGVLIHQWIWIILCVLVGRYLVFRACQRMVVQGG